MLSSSMSAVTGIGRSFATSRASSKLSAITDRPSSSMCSPKLFAPDLVEKHASP